MLTLTLNLTLNPNQVEARAAEAVQLHQQRAALQQQLGEARGDNQRMEQEQREAEQRQAEAEAAQQQVARQEAARQEAAAQLASPSPRAAQAVAVRTRRR